MLSLYPTKWHVLHSNKTYIFWNRKSVKHLLAPQDTQANTSKADAWQS